MSFPPSASRPTKELPAVPLPAAPCCSVTSVSPSRRRFQTTWHRLLSACLLLGLVWLPTARGAAPKLTLPRPSGATRGSTTTITLQGKIDTWPVQVWTNRPEVQVAVDKKKNQLSFTIAPECPPGVFLYRIYTPAWASATQPLVVGLIPEIAEVEPNNTPSAPQSAKLPVVVNGRFDSGGDVDMYAVDLKRGQTLVASIDSYRSLGSDSDAVLQIVTTEGFVLEQNDDAHDLDPQLVFQAPADGRYLVRAFSFPVKTNSSIAFAGGADFVYRLTLTTGPFLDHCLPMAVSREMPGEVQLRGWNLTDALRQVKVTVTPAAKEAWVAPEGVANAIPLLVVDGPSLVETPASDPAKPQVLPVPAVVTGTLVKDHEADIYAFTAKKGNRIKARLDGRGLGSLVDPLLSISDAAGKVLATVDDLGRGQFDPVTNLTAPADGEYRVTVRDRHDRGAAEFVYRLSLEAVVPDFSLSVAAETFTLAAGKTVEVPVTVTRNDGFGGEIEISATGLPEGVVAEPVKSLAKGETAKAVKLILKGGKEPVSGVFQVMGQTGGDGKQSHSAIFTGGGAIRHSELWLTVTKP